MHFNREWAITWWNPAAQMRPVLDSSSFCPRTNTSPQTCHHCAASVLSCHVIAMFVFRKQQEEWRSQ